MLPKDNELPVTIYEVKQVVCPMGLEIEKIHAYPNDCILYCGKEYDGWRNIYVCIYINLFSFNSNL